MSTKVSLADIHGIRHIGSHRTVARQEGVDVRFRLGIVRIEGMNDLRLKSSVCGISKTSNGNPRSVGEGRYFINEPLGCRSLVSKICGGNTSRSIQHEAHIHRLLTAGISHGGLSLRGAQETREENKTY